MIAAAVAFAENSNPDDDIFALAFNENVTRGASRRRAVHARHHRRCASALYKTIRRSGQSGVYNAVDVGLKYLERGKYERKVLVLVSDGGDNASAMTRAQILAKAQASNAVIYTVGVIDPLETEADPGFLRQLSDGERRRIVRAAQRGRGGQGASAGGARHPQHVHGGLRAVRRRPRKKSFAA